MKLRFTNHRVPTSMDDLTAAEQAQLMYAGVLYDGEELSAEERLSDDPAMEEQSFRGFLNLWDVVDDDAKGQLVYRYFSYMVDSGVFYVGDTLEFDADVILFYLHNPRTTEVAQALSDARDRQADELGESRFEVNKAFLDLE